MSRRFLFTGSRDWSDVESVAWVISTNMWYGDTAVHGDADGLDQIVDSLWRPHGLVEVHPAIRFVTPLIRNIHMVNLGAFECHAFALKWRSGTGHCARQARLAGIPTFDHGVDTRLEA